MKKNITAIILISIVLAGAIPYINTLHNPFIWDEEVIIAGNPIIKNLKYLPFIFKTNIFGGPVEAGSYYRPFYMLTFMADYHFWKLNVAGYHLVSIVLHIVNALLLYILAVRLGLHKKTAWLASMLFVLFPVNSEGIIPVATRDGLMMTLLSLLCILTFLNGLRISRLHFLGSVFIFISAVLTKESALVLPLILTAYILIFLEKPERKKAVLPLMVLAAVVFIYAGLRIFFAGNPFHGSHTTLSLINEAGFMERIYTFPKILLMYIGLTLFPLVLKSEYHFVVHTAKDAYVWLGFPALILVFTAACKFLKPRRHALFFICWFLIGLLPYYNIVIPLHNTLMEHWVYFSSMGFALLMSLTIFNIMDRINSRSLRYLLIGAVSMLLLFYAVRIIERSKEWKDPFTLYQKDAEREPNSFLLHCNLGVEYFRRGMMEEAKREFLLSNKVCPGAGYDMAYNNLGVIYAREGNVSQAIACYNAGINLNNCPLSFQNLGGLYNNLKMHKDAIFFLEKGSRLYPLDIEILYQLGVAYYEDGQAGLAKQTFEKVMSIQANYSNTETFLNLLQ